MYVSKFLLSKTYGINTKGQIEKQFDCVEKNDFNGLVLGSSLMYRGINPDYLSFSKCYNFAHDNDSYNQFYSKLEYVMSKRHIDYLILGVDYFNFSRLTSSRNLYYGRYLTDSYLNDYDESNIITKQQTYIEYNIRNSFKPFIKASSQLLTSHRNSLSLLKDNGQFTSPLKIAGVDEIGKKRESYKPLEIQLNNLQRITELCENNNIKLFLVFPPVREYFLDYPSKNVKNQLDSLFISYGKKRNIHFLNFSLDDRFTLPYYQDYIHLNVNGADKFSGIINNRILSIIENDRK